MEEDWFEARAMDKVDHVTLSESWEREEEGTDGGRGGGERARARAREEIRTGGGISSKGSHCH
jgi:hypothetical protein